LNTNGVETPPPFHFHSGHVILVSYSGWRMVVVMMAKEKRDEFIITTLSRVPLQHSTRAAK
jgi:hypothetical protein